MSSIDGLDVQIGAGLTSSASGEQRQLITDVTIGRRQDPPAMLPALRADLAPLVPAMGRTVAVLATVALADWALREGARALWQEGLANLAGRTFGAHTRVRAPTPPRQKETVIVERITLHRTSS